MTVWRWIWGPISNCDAIDTLHKKMMDIVDDPTKLLSKAFMMNMFGKYFDALLPFKKYWEHLFEKKHMAVVVTESGAKVLQFAELRNELFYPRDLTNAATDKHLVKLAKVATQEILDELHNEKKETWKCVFYWDLLFPIRDA
jgi:hypothetical protein